MEADPAQDPAPTRAPAVSEQNPVRRDRPIKEIKAPGHLPAENRAEIPGPAGRTAAAPRVDWVIPAPAAPGVQCKPEDHSIWIHVDVMAAAGINPAAASF
ncbi:MAG: hypothetical protein LLH30_13160 [Candidatus Manganitrophus sp. SA1]|nr:hypothetical protein [Candidatus Manganitrophus morganii]